MFQEFSLAKELKHSNIIEYLYFMRKVDDEKQNFEFHIVMELMNGEDMEVYLKE